MEWAGVKRDAYNSAFKELEKQGYLSSIGGNRYAFFEAGKSPTFTDNPSSKPIPIPKDKTDFDF